MGDDILQDENTNTEAVGISANDDTMKDFNFDDILETPGSADDILSDNLGEEVSAADFADANSLLAADSEENIISPINDEQPDIYNDDVAIPAEDNLTMDTDFNQASYADSSIADNSEYSAENVSAETVADYEEENENSYTVPIQSLGDGTSFIEPTNIAAIRSYDGSKTDKMYQIAKDFSSDNFNGTAEMDTIHVNVGYDTYGWNVAFADGVNMSLRDVKEYQIRNGVLPFSSGTISYGQEKLSFANVKRIVVYESVKYFSYGA